MPSAMAVLKRPLVTEKSHWLTEKHSTYVFQVDRHATKTDIKKAVEELYADKGINVVKVRTLVRPGKFRRTRFVKGRTSAVKKAFVTLKQGQTIDIG